MYGVAETMASRIPNQEEYIGATPVVAILPWFFAGALFPISALPGALTAFAKVLPLTHAMALMRYGLVDPHGTGLHDIWGMSNTDHRGVAQPRRRRALRRGAHRPGGALVHARRAALSANQHSPPPAAGTLPVEMRLSGLLRAVMGAAARRPLLVGLAVGLLALAGGVLALRLQPTAATDTLVGRGSASFAATERLHQRFGDEAVYVLVREPVTQLTLTSDILRVQGLEGCISGNAPKGAVPPGGKDGPCAQLAAQQAGEGRLRAGHLPQRGHRADPGPVQGRVHGPRRRRPSARPSRRGRWRAPSTRARRRCAGTASRPSSSSRPSSPRT